MAASETYAASDRVGVVVIHGVGESEPGWINASLVPTLTAGSEAPAFAPYSEVYDLADRGRTQTGRTFEAFVRRGQSSAGRGFALLELFWADLSRIGQSPFANGLVLLKLFYEAPQVLGDCFLDKSRNGLANAIAALVRLANWILRWPLTGLNMAALVCALGLLARQRALEAGQAQDIVTQHLPYTIAALLGVLSLAALLFARWRVHRDIALTDIGMSTMVFSALAAAAILITDLYVLPGAFGNPAFYLMAAGRIIFGIWYIWNYAIFIAIMLLAALAIQQLLRGPKTTAVRLARPAAAVGLSIIQGVIYKIVIALLWVVIFVTLDFNERTEAACASDPYRACAYLAEIRENLEGIVVFNLLMTGVLALTFFLVATLRSLWRIPARRRQSLDAFQMPRMVVSPLIILVLLAGTLFNLVIFYWRGFIPVDFYQMVNVRLLEWREVIGVLLGGGSALTVAFYVFRALQHASRGILHIVRDLVDHQYTHRFTLSRRLLPKSVNAASVYPRRARIQLRLDELINTLVACERFDRLIFVAHSQGSVILHDYLIGARNAEALRSVRAIDVVTLGSPLSHLYQYYFARYEAASSGRDALNPAISSWTNLWRVDDPIGNRVDLFEGDFIRNIPLRPGGHVDYWKEPAVRQVLLNLIDGRPATMALDDHSGMPDGSPPNRASVVPAV